MDTITTERHAAAAVSAAAAPAVAAPARYDMYAGIHKALRLFMSRTLTELGAADPGSPEEMGAALQRVRDLLDLCELHLKDENEFIHPALERARPGLVARAAADHAHHGESFADLRDLVALVGDSADAMRPAALARLYRALALFVGENFEHMHHEETVHNPALWAAYGDDELAEIERALVASIPPEAMMQALHWFIPALSAPERAGMLGGMSQGMPPEAFRAVLGIAERTLAPAPLARLRRDLGLVPA